MDEFPRTPISSGYTGKGMPRTSGYSRPRSIRSMASRKSDPESQLYMTETHPYDDSCETVPAHHSTKVTEKAKIEEKAKQSFKEKIVIKDEHKHHDHHDEHKHHDHHGYHHDHHDHHDDCDDHDESHKRHHNASVSGIVWIVWIILLFIIILFIVLAVFWFLRPDCVTKDEFNDDGGKDMDFSKGALYAFIITFFLVLIICACWYAVKR